MLPFPDLNMGQVEYGGSDECNPLPFEPPRATTIEPNLSALKFCYY